MMNKIFLMGRLGSDPKPKSFGNGGTYVNMSIAVPKGYKNANGEIDTDWFDIVAFRALADTCGKYLHKGSKIVVEGHLVNDNYVKDGVTIYKNKIIADKIEFCDSKKTVEEVATSTKTLVEEKPFGEGFMEIPKDLDKAAVKSGEEPETIEDVMERLWGL